MTNGRLVVIGASAGGVRALQTLAAGLSPDFPAPILVVLHVGSHRSILPELLTRKGPLPAIHAADGQAIAPGRIHVAPPDHHMLVQDGVLRLTRGPKENHTRPAVDPLFRTAALSWGARTIGVLLTGHLDDGTAGLQSIKSCGGTVVVQSPDDAEAPGMPLSALRFVQVDHQVPLASMATLLRSLAASDPVARVKPSAEILHENQIMLGKGDFMEHLKAIGRPSTFVCPDCEGCLWEVNATTPPRFRCHTGHAYTLRTLQHAQALGTDDALWGALRALQEKEMLLRTLAQSERGNGGEEADRLEREAVEVAAQAMTLRGVIENLPSPPE
ncbi:MAG TPA: chemotaxis protein CheB [Usitatibacter sp.]|nr:chemotaxis protein CheB [Usitatibacter sp.]